MTPTDFESRAREAREKLYWGENQMEHTTFLQGAQWARKETIAEVLELLRKKPYEGSWTEIKLAGRFADWLEREMEKE